jgi:hypothetical protein
MLDELNPSTLSISAAEGSGQHVSADADAVANTKVSMINLPAGETGRWRKLRGDKDLDDASKEKKKKKKKPKSGEEERKKKTALDYRVNNLLMMEKRLKKVRRKLYEEAYADCERITSSGEECSPIADDYDGDSVFGEGKDDEIFLEAATQYEHRLQHEQGLKVGGPYEHRLQYEQGLKVGGLAAMVVEVAAAATKELAGGSPTSEVLPQEG